MAQSSNGDGLASEAFGDHWIGGETRLQNLYGDLSRQRRIGSKPYFGHASLRDSSLQAITLGE